MSTAGSDFLWTNKNQKLCFVTPSMNVEHTLNSCSRKLKRRNSHDNSNAVNIGSLDDNDIKLGLAKALYAFIRDRECLNESSKRDITHSSQPHLNQREKTYD